MRVKIHTVLHKLEYAYRQGKNTFYPLYIFICAVIAGFSPITQLNFIQSASAATLQPTITSVSPANGPTAGGTNVTITGTNFSNYFNLREVSVGHDHSCAIGPDDKAYCWGNNTYGQLGNGNTTGSRTPIPVSTAGLLSGKTIVSIQAGGYHTCALTSDTSGNNAFCWGKNGAGQLGNGANVNSYTPVAVSGGRNFSQISAGWTENDANGHTCAVTSGTGPRAYCWGDNQYGQIGNNTTTNQNVPTGQHEGRIGGIFTPQYPVLRGMDIKQVSTGRELTCFLTTDGITACTGEGSAGALGTGNNNDASYPMPITKGDIGTNTVTQIAVGGSHACAIASNQRAYCWGYNANGQIGNGVDWNNNNTPRAVNTTGALSGKNIQSLELGGEISCAVTTDNHSACWGINNEGALGINTTNDPRNAPVSMWQGSANLVQGTITKINTGWHTTCAERNSGQIACWGNNGFGRVGDGTLIDRWTPTSISTPDNLLAVEFGGIPATSIIYNSSTSITATTPAQAPGIVHVYVKNPDGTSVVKSNAYTYQAPVPTISSISPTSGPTAGGTQVTISGTNFLQDRPMSPQISSGTAHTCGISDGKAYCWGGNYKGQFGNGNTTNSKIPVVAGGSTFNGKTVTDISAGYSHTCALADGQMYCWGDNMAGQVGNGSTVDTNTPTAVNLGGTVTHMTAGYATSCAIVAGKLYCWGQNSQGQLGNGNTTNSSTPVAVHHTHPSLSGKTITDVAATYNNVCALADGQVYCWGDNSAGQLGNGGTADSSTPVAVSISGTVTDISAGYNHVCALVDGNAYCWGENSVGQLGNGNTSNSNTPVAVNTSGVLSGVSISKLSAGYYTTCATDGQAYCWGYNADGQVGTTNSVPVAISNGQIPSNSGIVGISPGYLHTCAISGDSTYCWGGNNYGQLGDGVTLASNTPVRTNDTNITPSSSPVVMFGGLTSSTETVYVSPTQLIATTPAYPAGVVDVDVLSGTYTATLANSYTYIAPVTPPSAPTNLATTPAANGVTLNWTAPANNGGAPVTDYKVEYSSNGGSTWQTFTHPPSASTNITVTGLTPHTTYTFRVSAINSAGQGPASATATGEPIYVTVGSSATVSINVAPTADSRTSSASHTVTVDTNSPLGYNLTLSMQGSDRLLKKGTDTIGPTSGTIASPGQLAVNTWGFRIPGWSGFGSGASIESNVANSSYTWAGVPNNSAPITIRTSSSPAQDSASVWYGMRVNTEKPSGTYSGSVIYTAVAN
ncbi:hypothetical protein GX865_00745 [Candidatus Saccharibacteria bacterium]|nr:hypothetical protein [Candidatus Saccharibacteria bacterium]